MCWAPGRIYAGGNGPVESLSIHFAAFSHSAPIPMRRRGRLRENETQIEEIKGGIYVRPSMVCLS
jgi:hypothetical protein